MLPGQTLIFLGDHTSPDDPGFVRIISDVLRRFHPHLRLNLISAGSPGQTASSLRSRPLLDLLLSSRPDWLIINIGLADALREPQLPHLLSLYRSYITANDDPLGDDTLGPEQGRVQSSTFKIQSSYAPLNLEPGTLNSLWPHSDSGTIPTIEWTGLQPFQQNLAAALHELAPTRIRDQGRGISSERRDAPANSLLATDPSSLIPDPSHPIQCALMTTVAVGNDLQHPLNLALRAYNRAIRQLAASTSTPLIDVEPAFRNLLERATNYKQKVALTDQFGLANPHAHALLARTFLISFGLLPSSK